MVSWKMQNNKIKDKNTLKWLFGVAKGQLFVVFALALISTVMSFLGVIFAFMCRNVIDSAVSGSREALGFDLLILLGLILSQVTLKFLQQWFSARASAKTEIAFKKRLFSTILKKDYGVIKEMPSGDIMTRLTNDISVISDGVINLLPSVVSMLSALIFATASLIIIDTKFALIFLIGGFLILIVASILRQLVKSLHKKAMETEGKLRSFFYESIGGMLMIKVFGIEERIESISDEYQKENYKAKLRRQYVGIFAGTGLTLVFQLGYIFAFGYSAFGLLGGAVTVGTVTAILQLVNQIQTPFAGITGIMPRYFVVLASAERVLEIENIADEKGLDKKEINPEKTYKKLSSIVFNNITFSYDREIILSGANLEIEKGDFAVITGLSGIGKSTLLKLLLGVNSPDGGEIHLSLSDGKDIQISKRTRPLFSYVPQNSLLLSGTIKEAISITKPDATDEDIENALKISCADGFIKEFPLGLETRIGERGLGLSEGQIQRLAIARAILSDRSVILLDESTSALDEETERELLANLKGLKNKTLVIISHKKASYEICNKEIKIRNKKIYTKDI